MMRPVRFLLITLTAAWCGWHIRTHTPGQLRLFQLLVTVAVLQREAHSGTLLEPLGTQRR